MDDVQMWVFLVNMIGLVIIIKSLYALYRSSMNDCYEDVFSSLGFIVASAFLGILLISLVGQIPADDTQVFSSESRNPENITEKPIKAISLNEQFSTVDQI